MDNETVNEVLDRIDSIGEAISEGAVAGFDVLVKQAILSGVGMAVAGLLFVAIGVFVYRLAINFKQNANDRYTALIKRLESDGYPFRGDTKQALHAYEKYLVGYNAVRLAGVLVAAASVPFFLGAMYRFINPAYYAIQEVLQTFG